MIVNRKVTGRAVSVPKGICLGVAASMGTTVVLSAVIAHLISTEQLKQEWIGYGSMVILTVAASIGAWIAAKKIKRIPLGMGILNGLVYFLTLLAMTAMFFGGQYGGLGVTLVCILLGSGAGGAAVTGRVIHKKGRGYQKAYR